MIAQNYLVIFGYEMFKVTYRVPGHPQLSDTRITKYYFGASGIEDLTHQYDGKDAIIEVIES